MSRDNAAVRFPMWKWNSKLRETENYAVFRNLRYVLLVSSFTVHFMFTEVVIVARKKSYASVQTNIVAGVDWHASNISQPFAG
jgi:hypothetical protein